jgi:hypothetical protein
MENEKGKKFDGGKLRFDLIPPECEAMIAAVLTMGAMKYAPDNWQQVEGFDWRYYNGKMRHSNQRRLGEVFDEDSGLPHSAHVAVNAIFELWKDIQDKVGRDNVLAFIELTLSEYKQKIELTLSEYKQKLEAKNKV